MLVVDAINVAVIPRGLSGSQDRKALRSSTDDMRFTLVQYPSSKMIL